MHSPARAHFRDPHETAARANAKKTHGSYSPRRRVPKPKDNRRKRGTRFVQDVDMARKLRQYLLGVGLHSLVNGLGSLPVILPRTIKAKKTGNLHRMPLSSFAAAAATTSPLTYNSSLFTLPPSLGTTEHILGFTSPSANLASLHHSSNDTVTLFPFASAQLEASSFGFDAYPITKDTITPSHAVFMDVPHASEWDPDTSLVVPGAPTMHTIPLPLVPSCTMVEDEEVVLLGDGEAPTPRQCLAWGTDELRLGGLDVCVPVALF